MKLITRNLFYENRYEENGYLLNRQFSNFTVLCASKTREEVLKNGIQFGDCKIYVLGPANAQLNCLAHELDISLVKLSAHEKAVPSLEEAEIIFLKEFGRFHNQCKADMMRNFDYQKLQIIHF